MTDPPTLSLRERKKQRTRELLIDTAMRLFLERGFDTATVDQIAEAAEVSQRTFFRYFPSKEAVVFTQHERRIARFRELLAEASSDGRPPLAAVREALIGVADLYQSERRELLAEYRIVTASPLLVARDVELDLEYEQAIAEMLGASAGSDAAAIRRARILAGALFGAVRAAMSEWFEGGCRVSLLDLGGEALSIFESVTRS